MPGKSIKALLVLLSLCTFFHNFTVIAEEDDDSARGRLPDGRAYRTDEDGTQLVDYIAELEQGIAESGRKIISLEDENTALKAELERVKAGRSEQLIEKNLLGDDVPIENSESEIEYRVAALDCPEPQKCNCPEVQCPMPEYKEISCPQPPEESEFECPEQQECFCPEKFCPEMEQPECPDCAECVQEVELEDFEDSLEKIESLQTKITGLEQELVSIRQEKEQISVALQKSISEAESQARIADRSREMRAAMKPELESSRHKAVDLIKSRLIRELQLLQSRKDERDLLFSKHVVTRHGVVLKPSPLRAKSGRELAQLDELIKKSETAAELSLIRVDLEEIRRQMADDLALIDRMSKLPKG